MPNTISPNMGLIVPGVGTEPGPTWASDLNADLGILDQHDHSSGQGVQITPNGLNISSDLSMNANNLIAVRTVNFDAQLSALPGVAPDLGVVYVAGNELYYNDEVGNVVQITNAGSVNSGAGSISGLPSGTASASYSSGGAKFIWQSATSTAAGMDGGPVTIREILSGANGVTLESVNSLAADYSIVLPTLPASVKIVTLDNAGNMSTPFYIDNVTIESNGTNLQIKDQGVTQAKAAIRATGSTVGAGGFAISPSCGAFATGSATPDLITNFTITITTLGNPVKVGFQTDGTGAASRMGMVTGAPLQYALTINRDATTILFEQPSSASGQSFIPVGSINVIDVVAAGTYTYTGYLSFQSGVAPASIDNAVIYAYELG